MRLVSSKTLLTLATALVAVPGAAIAAAEPGEPLFQVASSDTGEIDCEALPEDEEADEVDSDETTADADDTVEDDTVEAEECEDDDADADADADDDGAEGNTEDEELTGDDVTDEEADDGDVGSEDTGEGDGTEDAEEEADDDAHGEIVSAVAACAPRGQERVDGFDLPNHGAYVSAAAKGETLEVGEEYDLGTLEGATALCDDLDAARDAGGPEDEGTGDTDDTAEVETSEVEESEGPAGPATEQQRGGESGPPEQAGNAGGGKGKGAQDAPGRNR